MFVLEQIQRGVETRMPMTRAHFERLVAEHIVTMKHVMGDNMAWVNITDQWRCRCTRKGLEFQSGE